MNVLNLVMQGGNIHSYEEISKCLLALDFSKLPGISAQLNMAPPHRLEELLSRGEGKRAVRSAVLLLIYPTKESKAGLVFIQRPQYDGAHSGQISLPGGRFEPSDSSLEYTALRESYEEIGVPPDKVEVVGKLTDLFIPPSNFLVSPYIGIIAERPDFVIDKNEVEHIIEVDLEVFFNPQYCVTKELHLRHGYSIKTPCYVINGYTIWGATAMIIAEFVSMLRRRVRP